MRVHLTRGRRLATNVGAGKKQPSGRHVDPDWVNNNSLLLSYYAKRKQFHPSPGICATLFKVTTTSSMLWRTKYSFHNKQ